MGLQDFIALGLAGGAVYYVVRSLRRSMRGESGCGCSGGSCSSSGADAEDRRMPKRIPYVPADQLMSSKRGTENDGAGH